MANTNQDEDDDIFALDFPLFPVPPTSEGEELTSSAFPVYFPNVDDGPSPQVRLVPSNGAIEDNDPPDFIPISSPVHFPPPSAIEERGNLTSAFPVDFSNVNNVKRPSRQQGKSGSNMMGSSENETPFTEESRVDFPPPPAFLKENLTSPFATTTDDGPSQKKSSIKGQENPPTSILTDFPTPTFEKKLKKLTPAFPVDFARDVDDGPTERKSSINDAIENGTIVPDFPPPAFEKIPTFQPDFASNVDDDPSHRKSSIDGQKNATTVPDFPPPAFEKIPTFQPDFASNVDDDPSHRKSSVKGHKNATTITPDFPPPTIKKKKLASSTFQPDFASNIDDGFQQGKFHSINEQENACIVTPDFSLPTIGERGKVTSPFSAEFACHVNRPSQARFLRTNKSEDASTVTPDFPHPAFENERTDNLTAQLQAEFSKNRPSSVGMSSVYGYEDVTVASSSTHTRNNIRKGKDMVGERPSRVDSSLLGYEDASTVTPDFPHPAFENERTDDLTAQLQAEFGKNRPSSVGLSSVYGYEDVTVASSTHTRNNSRQGKDMIDERPSRVDSSLFGYEDVSTVQSRPSVADKKSPKQARQRKQGLYERIDPLDVPEFSTSGLSVLQGTGVQPMLPLNRTQIKRLAEIEEVNQRLRHAMAKIDIVELTFVNLLAQLTKPLESKLSDYKADTEDEIHRMFSKKFAQ